MLMAEMLPLQINILQFIFIFEFKRFTHFRDLFLIASGAKKQYRYK